jgi:hypothetical protein
VNGQLAERIVDDDVWPRHEDEEIGRVRELLRPHPGTHAFLGSVARFQKPSIREDAVIVPHGDDGLLGSAIVGMVVAGKPVTRPLGKRQGVDEGRVVRGLPLEIETEIIARRHPIVLRIHVDVVRIVRNGYRRRLAVAQWMRKQDREPTVRLLEGKRRGIGARDPTHQERLGIEVHPIEIVPERGEGDGGTAPERAILLLQSELDTVMLDVHLAAPLVSERPRGNVDLLGVRANGMKERGENQRSNDPRHPLSR